MHAHARRKFHDIHEVHPSPITTEALDRIGTLYGIEREIRGQTAHRRQEVRQARAKPLLDQLHRWLEQKLATLSAKSDTAAAIRYALSRWRALTRYVDEGLIEIDNSCAERALRAVALGRRNYLFAGADSGGHRAANIYSLVGSAKLNGMDPELYLRTVLTRIAEHPINRIDERHISRCTHCRGRSVPENMRIVTTTFVLSKGTEPLVTVWVYLFSISMG